MEPNPVTPTTHDSRCALPGIARWLAPVLLALASCVAPVPVAPPVPLRVEPDAAVPFDDRLPPEPRKVPHEPEPWPFDVQHYDIDLAIDFEREAIAGAVTVHVTDTEDGVEALPLHVAGMRIGDVRDASGAQVDRALDGERLLLSLPGGSRTGTERTFTIAYETAPARGLHFMRAPEGRPEWGRHVWSQGECEDTRWWIPCHDAPDDRATHAMSVTVPAGMTVVAAGELVAHEEDGGSATWRYRMDVPHVSYLMTLVAGDLITIEDSAGETPLEYVAPPYEEPHLASSLGRTPDIVAFFEQLTHHPYPYAKYAQCCVRDFVFGGMENISATTLTDGTLHPPDWEPARSSDGLVAHEAAHQWFGDLITCRDWSHIWLNEGFATYLTLLWKEHDEGRDAFLAAMRGTMNGALGACERARRPVVSNVYAQPFDLFFDGHAYGGGAARLHALRNELGDERFFAAIRLYVDRYAGRCVTTADFEEAVSEAAGEDMTWWFDQWLRKPGRPKLAVSWAWLESEKILRLTVKQTHGEKAFPPVYRLRLGVAIHLPERAGIMKVHPLLTQREESFDFGLPERPALVSVDPDRGALARIDVKRAAEEWCDVATMSRSAAERLDAIAQIGKLARRQQDSPLRRRARDLLAQLSRVDPVDALRKAAVAEVRRAPRAWAKPILLRALRNDADLRIRLDIVSTLGEWDGDGEAEAALRATAGDPNDLLRAAALRGLAKLDADGAYDLLVAALDTPGWHSHVRGAALEGFADLGDERAFGLLVAAAARDADPWTRDEALSALGRMGAERPEYTEALLQHLGDHRKPVRRAAASGLARLADPGAVPALMEAFRAERWPGNRRPLRKAIVACRKAAVLAGDLVTVEAVRAAELRARHAAARDGDDEASKQEARRLAAELRVLGVPPLPRPKKAP